MAKIKNTFVPNSFGDGYEKEIIKKGEKTTVDEPLSFTIFKCILAIFGLFIIFGLVKLNIILIIIGVFGFLATIVIFCSNNLKAAIKILLLLLGVSIPVIIGVIILCAISIPHCVLENLF